MKKILLLCLALSIGFLASAQKYAVVDSEYILGKMPKYKSAMDQIEKSTTEYQKLVDNAFAEVDKLYQSYEAEKVMLSSDQKAKRQKQILEKEKAAQDLRKQYLGPEGLLLKKREELVKPILDQVYNAIKDFATEGSYAVIFDAANNNTVYYVNTRYDVSDQILKKIGL